MQTTLECKQCGGVLAPEEGQKIVYCKFCGSANVISIPDRFGLYNRANYLRRKNEFDRALGIYEDIVREDPTDSEGYYGIALCKYGIEYVDDPESARKVPTCHRTRLTPISQDADFQKAIEYANPDTKQLYLSEAERIDTILKRIIELSSKQEKYDVFICYKDGDGHGGRTEASVLAQDIYEYLTERDYRVFFSRKTLENKLGNEYEPIIFSALYSAKVMLLVGTKPEEYNSVWVKNEWVRFMERISTGDDCTIIPLYKDMSPYELPSEMASIQALDMSKIGYKQDLTDGLSKIVDAEKKRSQQQNVTQGIAGSKDSHKKRAFLFLEQGDFKSAEQYFERVLDQDPEDSDSYWGKLLAKFECRQEDDIENSIVSISDLLDYKLALRFADDEQAEKYKRYSDLIDTRLYEEQKRKEEEERACREQEQREKEEEIRRKKELEEEKKHKLEEERKKQKLLLRKAGKLLIVLISYVFIGQFLIIGMGNGVLKLFGRYQAAYNFVGFMESIPVANRVYELPVLNRILDLCQKEPDYYKKIMNWDTPAEELPEDIDWTICGGDVFLVTIYDGELLYHYIGREEYSGIFNYLFAKRLHDLKNDGKRIKNLYGAMNRYNLLTLYKNGKVECIYTYSNEPFPWQDEQDYGYITEYRHLNNYDEVDGWRNIEALKGSDCYIYGLKSNGDIVKARISDFGLDSGEVSDWSSVPDGLYPLIKEVE
ncbi:MAG: TIR domain-containing protein [Lachnospiraceae bacterium]|nr:TIR domain-containing protein [Lachnospiraceae bacterium]